MNSIKKTTTSPVALARIAGFLYLLTVPLGVLLIIAGFGYLLDIFAGFLIPGSNLSIGLFTGLAEIIFLLWLLIKGVNVEK